MVFHKQFRYVLFLLGLLICVAAILIFQFKGRRPGHVELREAFILLQTRGYAKEADRLYRRLLEGIPNLSNKALIDDFQRTLQLVDPSLQHPENLIWKYHWTVSNEMERRSESTLKKALKLADEGN